MGKINVVTKRVGNPPVFEEMEHTLENMQAKVGGWLDVVRLPENIDMWVNDEGLINGMPLNLITYVENEQVHQICGDVLFTSHDEDANTIGLTERQIMWISNRFQIIGKVREGDLQQFVFGLIVR